MNILINLLSIKSGGGQKVAFNFIEQSEQIALNHNIYYIVTDGTLISNYAKEGKHGNVFTVGHTLLSRLWFQYYKIRKIVDLEQIDVIYTLFGISINNTKALSVVGSAYSNIYYPEVKFWPSSNPIKLIFYTLRDCYRLKSTLNADAIIFENKSIMNQARELFAVSYQNSLFIPPSFSMSDILSSNGGNTKPKMTNLFRGLMLTGYHNNKNIEMVPYILNDLNGIHDNVTHIITISIDRKDKRLSDIIATAEQLNVEDQIEFIGPVNPNEISQLYKASNYVLLLSGLESFSNNIIEAWVHSKPLVISDQPWARSICNNAAIYVARDNSKHIATSICQLKDDNELYDKIIQNGHGELRMYPSPKDKVIKQYEFLEKIYLQYH